MTKNSVMLALLTSIVVVSCSTSPSLECEDLIREDWGFDEGEFGYDVEEPTRTDYKLVTDEDGTVYILDVYNGRIAKYDSTGQFEFYMKLAPVHLAAGEEIRDIAVTSSGLLLAAIAAPTEFEAEVPRAYVAIYVYNSEGYLLFPLDDWRESPALEERVELGLQYQHPFHYLVGGIDGSGYSIWTTGQITLHTPERTSRTIYNMPWNDVVSGWDGNLYILGTDGNLEKVLVKFESLNGNVVERVNLTENPTLSFIAPRDILKGVDAEGQLYFQRYDELTDQLSVVIMDWDGNLEEELPIPGVLASVGPQGQLYLFSRENIPDEPLLIRKCQHLR